MEINNEFNITDIVYVKTDKDQYPRIVQGFLVYPNEIKYYVCLNEAATYFYGFELSKEKNFLSSNKNKVGFSNG